jgi:hypothetical protein
MCSKLPWPLPIFLYFVEVSQRLLHWFRYG